MRRPSPTLVALAGALASALVVVACGSSEPEPADAGRPDTGEPDAGTDAGPPMPEGPAKRLFAKRFVVKVHARPDREAERLGYLRAGVVIEATTSGPLGTEGCREGWYELSSGGGYVCNGRDVIAFDGRRLPARPPAQPDLDAPVPYTYGRTRRDATPMYRRLPTDEEAAEFEGYRIPGTEPVEGAEGEGAPAEGEAPAPAEAPAPESAPPPPVDEGGVELSASGPALTAATEGEVPPEELVPTLASLEGERGSVLMRRVLRGFIVSIDRDLRTGARRYWRTLSNGFVPYFALNQPITGSEFRGVLLDPPSAGGGEDAGVDAGLGAGLDAGRRRRAAAAPTPPPVLHLPIGWVTSSKTAGYVRGSNGRPRRGRAPGYHVMFPVVGEETHGDEAYAVAHDGAMYRVRDIAIARPVTERPEGVGEGERWIDVNLEQQTLVAYEDLTPIFATLVSSGRVRDPDDPLATFATPTGLFRITSKHITHTMDGDHAVDGPYSIEDVPYVMYFQLAYALHSAFWHNGFGHPRSHGCVNLAPLDARWLFNWATPALPTGWHAIFPSEADPGTWVWIHGETPEG